MSLSQQFHAMVTSLIVGNPKATISELRTLVIDNRAALGPMTLEECFGLGESSDAPRAATGKPAKIPKAKGPGKSAGKKGASKGKGKGAGKKAKTPKTPKTPKTKKSALNGKAPKASASSGPLNPKTPAGREHIDEVVFTHLRKLGGDKVSGATIRESINNELGEDAIDVAQCRTSLNRLITEARTVNFQGKARGTTYSVV